jgi:hypoxanthine phosphoribosyltransferase
MIEIRGMLFDEQTIAKKVKELADRISTDYAGKDLVLVCILKGAVVFMADLMRCLSMPVSIDFVRAASYGVSTEPSRNIVITKDIETDIKGKHVLLVDTIIDTGETLHCLLEKMGEGPRESRSRGPVGQETAAYGRSNACVQGF